ncbi:MAG TPA: polymer-forming cytoskeletal protein [Spirochaetia bacterium]
MAEVRIKDIDEHEIDTILAEDIDFEGYLTFQKPLMIKGKFKGEIKSTSSLYIGEKAYVEATTEAAVVSSKGRHKGNIVGHSRVELYSTAQVDGDITTPDFVVESGCKFNGYCNMSGEPRGDGQRAHPQGQAGQQHGQPGGQQGQQPQGQGGQQGGNQHPQQQGGQHGPQSQGNGPQQPQGQHGQQAQPGGQHPQQQGGGPQQQQGQHQGQAGQQQRPPVPPAGQGGQQR